MQLEKELRQRQEIGRLGEPPQDQFADPGFDTKAEHEQHAPEHVNIRPGNRLDLSSPVLRRVGTDRHTDTNESRVSNLMEDWQAKVNQLSKERSREKPDLSAVQIAHDAVRQAEEDVGECEEEAEILKI